MMGSQHIRMRCIVPGSPREKVAGWLQSYLPRFLAVMWAAWAAATAFAYVGTVPNQLAAVDAAIPVPMWTLWSVAAVALALGVLVPSGAPNLVQNIARWLRIAGMVLIAAELVIWAFAFFADDPRGWVSGKNYLLLGAMALFSTWTIARDHARVRQVMPHGH